MSDVQCQVLGVELHLGQRPSTLQMNARDRAATANFALALQEPSTHELLSGPAKAAEAWRSREHPPNR